MMYVSATRRLWCGVCLLLTWLSGLVTGRELCSVAQNRCVSRIGCSMALSNFFLNCGQVIHGETKQCNTRCKKSLISLLSTDDQEGEAYINCDCGGSSFCERQRQRMEVCSKDVLPAMKSIYDDTTVISCSLAELICRADSPCLVALEYYEQHCQKLWRGEKCTSRCNNSLDILYRQDKAKKLRNCTCDGTEDYPVPCETMHEYTETLCFGTNHRRNHRRHHSHRNSTCSGSQTHSKSQDSAHTDETGQYASNDTDDVNYNRLHEPSKSHTLHSQSGLCWVVIIASWCFLQSITGSSCIR